jgi:hypothetical protein
MSHKSLSLDERLAKHPQLREQVLQLLRIAESNQIVRADEAEEAIIEGVRGLGQRILEEWARHQEQSQQEAVQNDETVRPHQKKLHWMSSFGEIVLEEQTFLKGGQLTRPFSRAAEVKCRGYSVPLQRRITDFGAERSFAKAGRQLKEHYGLEIPIGAIRSITEGHGERMHGDAQLLQGPGKADNVQQLVVETDGSMIPKVEVDEEAEGDRRKTRQIGWKEARLSLAYSTGSSEPVFAVTTGTAEQAAEQLMACAQTAGLGADTQVHGIGDGAIWIAEQMQVCFGAQGRFTIDFYHLCEYLAAASKHCSDDPDHWYREQAAAMKAGKLNAVLASLLAHVEAPEIADKDAPARACYRYIRNRPGQFDYPRAIAEGLPIGSGEIESAHRYVIQERMKISGAWWKVDNAEKMLALRTLRANGNWDEYWKSAKAA